MTKKLSRELKEKECLLAFLCCVCVNVKKKIDKNNVLMQYFLA